MFASQSKAHILHLHNLLSSTSKDKMFAAAYYAKMCGYADEKSAARKPLDDQDLMSFIVTGLDSEYNPMVENNVGHANTVSLGDFYAQFLSAEVRSVVAVAATLVTALLVATSTVAVVVLLRRPLNTTLNARSARSMVMKLISSGTDAIGTMFLKIRRQMLRCRLPTTSTPPVYGYWGYGSHHRGS